MQNAQCTMHNCCVVMATDFECRVDDHIRPRVDVVIDPYGRGTDFSLSSK